ncbi:MAG: HEAT repeat domain-containing protein, partial [Cyanothece sp. SIO1E1]|nr:HEAT repeat domain-containing protein [Cyanothece sp. SIO1E1]
SDDSGDVRRAAVQELARGWKEDPDTLPMLKERAQSDDSGAVRIAAVEELARGWKEDPDTLPMLKERAQSDDYWDVRIAAVEELARGWKEDPDTLPMLKEQAQSDDSGAVRRAAVQELARGWKEDSSLLDFWCDRILNDPFEREDDFEANPRQIALKVLVQQYPTHPKTYELLADRAQNDNDEQLRKWAQRQLNHF